MSSGAKRTITVVANSALFVAVAYVGFLTYSFWRTALALKQVRNCADLQTLTHVIEAFHEKAARYPISIREAVDASAMSQSNKAYYRRRRDAWGGAFLYRVRADRFTLVSYGRDRKPDVAATSRSPAFTEATACAELGADIFANETGVVRCCGK